MPQLSSRSRAAAFDEISDSLEQLIYDLKKAKHDYEQGGEGLRLGAIQAALGCVNFIKSIPGLDATLAAPLLRVAIVLQELELGISDQILEPRQFANRHPDGLHRQAVRAYASWSVDLLHRAGFTVRDAADVVASKLKDLGFMIGSRPPTGPAILKWRERCRAKGANDFAARNYRDISSRHVEFSTSDKAVLKRDILKRMVALVRAAGGTP